MIVKIPKQASKVKSKLKTGDNNYNNNYSDFAPVDHRQNASDYSRNEPGIHKILSSKAEAWMSKKGISWPWKGNENENNQTQENEIESQHYERRSAGSNNEAPWSGSTNCNYINKIDIDMDNLDVEVSWDDLIVGEQIGQGIASFI